MFKTYIITILIFSGLFVFQYRQIVEINNRLDSMDRVIELQNHSSVIKDENNIKSKLNDLENEIVKIRSISEPEVPIRIVKTETPKEENTSLKIEKCKNKWLSEKTSVMTQSAFDQAISIAERARTENKVVDFNEILKSFENNIRSEGYDNCLNQ